METTNNKQLLVSSLLNAIEEEIKELQDVLQLNDSLLLDSKELLLSGHDTLHNTAESQKRTTAKLIKLRGELTTLLKMQTKGLKKCTKIEIGALVTIEWETGVQATLFFLTVAPAGSIIQGFDVKVINFDGPVGVALKGQTVSDKFITVGNINKLKILSIE